MSITYGEYGLIQSGIKNGNSQYLQWEIASSELKKLVLTFSSNNYELMNKYLDNMRAETDEWDGKRSVISDSNGTYIYDMKDIKDIFNGQE